MRFFFFFLEALVNYFILTVPPSKLKTLHTRAWTLKCLQSCQYWTLLLYNEFMLQFYLFSNIL